MPGKSKVTYWCFEKNVYSDVFFIKLLTISHFFVMSRCSEPKNSPFPQRLHQVHRFPCGFTVPQKLAEYGERWYDPWLDLGVTMGKYMGNLCLGTKPYSCCCIWGGGGCISSATCPPKCPMWFFVRVFLRPSIHSRTILTCQICKRCRHCF
jgi:hypothetical protein